MELSSAHDMAALSDPKGTPIGVTAILVLVALVSPERGRIVF